MQLITAGPLVYSIILNGASQPGGQSSTGLLPFFDLLNHDMKQEVSHHCWRTEACTFPFLLLPSFQCSVTWSGGHAQFTPSVGIISSHCCVLSCGGMAMLHRTPQSCAALFDFGGVVAALFSHAHPIDLCSLMSLLCCLCCPEACCQTLTCG